MPKKNLINYTLQLADNNLILSQRLGEWCGHGPVLEQDIAMTNIALDLIGQARSLYQYAAETEGKGQTEDGLAMKRLEQDYKNALLVEQPNKDFAYTVARQFFFDAFNYLLCDSLRNSKDATIAAVAEKAIKEVSYHLKWSSEWMIRLGDGTDISHDKIQQAVNDMWMYTGELFEMTETDKAAFKAGIGPDLAALKPKWEAKVAEVFNEATLLQPANNWMQSGGKTGNHSEHMGYLLADLQYMQRAYPDLEW